MHGASTRVELARLGILLLGVWVLWDVGVGALGLGIRVHARRHTQTSAILPDDLVEGLLKF